MTSKNISHKKSINTHKKRREKEPLALKKLQLAGSDIKNQPETFVKITADCHPRRTIHYAVTEQEIDSLRDCAMYAHHFDTVIGILLGALVSLFLELLWDCSQLVTKIIVAFIIAFFAGWLYYLKRKTWSRSEKIWQYIKKASEAICESKKKEGTP